MPTSYFFSISNGAKNVYTQPASAAPGRGAKHLKESAEESKTQAKIGKLEYDNEHLRFQNIVKDEKIQTLEAQKLELEKVGLNLDCFLICKTYK